MRTRAIAALWGRHLFGEYGRSMEGDLGHLLVSFGQDRAGEVFRLAAAR